MSSSITDLIEYARQFDIKDEDIVGAEDVAEFAFKVIWQARNAALEECAKYLQRYAANMEEPMCEYTHTQKEAQKYILKRCAKAIRELKETE